MDYVSQIYVFPLSSKKTSRKPRFTSRGNMVTNLTTHENRESLSSKANHFEDMFRPTSDDFVPSVEINNSSINQMHYEEALMIDTVPRIQFNLSATSSNSYQGRVTDNHQHCLVRTYPRRRKAISLTTIPHLNPLCIKCLTPIKM